MLLNKELVIGGDFSVWPGDNPADWIVTGEVGIDPEISEVGAGEGHGGAGTGYCNLYTSDGTVIYMEQDVAIVIGRKYRFSININTATTGAIKVTEFTGTMWSPVVYNWPGIYTFTFVATVTTLTLRIARNLAAGANDITFDNVSIREDIPAELSRTGCHFASHQEM